MLLAGVACLFTGQAQRLINVDFCGGTTTQKVGKAAYGESTNDFWNFYTRDAANGGFRGLGVVTNLQSADHVFTGADMTVKNASGAWGNNALDAMFDSYVYPFNNDDITIAFAYLPPGRFDFFLYGHGAAVDANSIFTIHNGQRVYGPKATSLGQGWVALPLAEG